MRFSQMSLVWQQLLLGTAMLCGAWLMPAAAAAAAAGVDTSGPEFGRLQRRIFAFTDSDPYPTEQAFTDLGDWYFRHGDAASALKYFSLGLHADPFSYPLRERVDAVRAAQPGGKGAVSMCKWRGNVFTQSHEVATALGMVHAQANRIRESLVFFFNSVERSFKNAMNSHTNLAVSLYRLAGQASGNPKKHRTLMATAYHAIHHNPDKLDGGNAAILNYLDEWYNGLSSKDQAYVRKKRAISPPKVAVCGKSSMYSYAAYNFIEGMLLMRGYRWPEAEIMLQASYTAEADPTTAAALAWVSLQRQKPLVGLQWIERAGAAGSPVARALSALDWQQSGDGGSDRAAAEDDARNDANDSGGDGTETDVYNLSDDPEADRSAAHVAGAGGNVDAWRDFLGTWWQRQRLELAKLREGNDNVLQTAEGVKSSRFLIGYLPDVGLGNQVTSLISYVLMAMLMDRALLLYWPEALDHNFKNLQDSVQLQLQNWVLEDSAPFVRLDLAVRYSQTLVFMEDSYGQDTDFFQALVCGDLNAHATAPFVYALTNQNLFRMLEANPLYADKLRAVFGENLFGVLTTWLVKPRPHIQAFVDGYVEKYFQAEPHGFSGAAVGGGQPHHVVGVHMRSGMQENSQDVKILYVNNREPVYEGLVDNIGDIVQRETAIVRAASGVGGAGGVAPRVLIFMAVDNAPLKARASAWLREQFGSAAVVSAEDGRKLLNSSLSMRIERHSTAGMAGAVIDMLLLSRCHAVVRVGKALSLFTSLAASQMQDARSRVYYAPPTGQCAAGRLSEPLYGVAFSGQQSRIAINEGVVMEHNMLRCWGKGPQEVVRVLDQHEWLYPSCPSVTRNFTHPDVLHGKMPQLLPPRPRA